MKRETNGNTKPFEKRQPASSCTLADERRKEQRWCPEGLKTVVVFGNVLAVVRDESKGGICLKLPVDTAIDMGQQLDVDDDGNSKTGRVCWTTVDNFGSHRLVGLAWV